MFFPPLVLFLLRGRLPLPLTPLPRILLPPPAPPLDFLTDPEPEPKPVFEPRGARFCGVTSEVSMAAFWPETLNEPVPPLTSLRIFPRRSVMARGVGFSASEVAIKEEWGEVVSCWR